MKSTRTLFLVAALTLLFFSGDGLADCEQDCLGEKADCYSDAASNFNICKGWADQRKATCEQQAYNAWMNCLAFQPEWICNPAYYQEMQYCQTDYNDDMTYCWNDRNYDEDLCDADYLDCLDGC